jgi:hypothetical protein
MNEGLGLISSLPLPHTQRHKKAKAVEKNIEDLEYEDITTDREEVSKGSTVCCTLTTNLKIQKQLMIS